MYGLGIISRLDGISNIATYLSEINILYSKILQSLSIGSTYLTNHEMTMLSRFNDNAPYVSSELYNINDIVKNINDALEDSTLILNNNIPVKSGVISLVYYGTLNNQDIVIKVKRKNIEYNLIRDLDNIQFIINITRYIPYLNTFNLSIVFQETRDMLTSQLDFNQEMRHINKVRFNYRNLSKFVIPKAYERCTEIDDRVIVMDRLYGKNLLEITNSSDSSDNKEYSALLSQFIIKSFLHDRLYHADLHAGNLFFMNVDGENKIGIIDYGIMGTVTAHDQNIYYNFFMKLLIDKQPWDSAEILMLGLIYPKHRYLELSEERKLEVLTKTSTIISNIIKSNTTIELHHLFDINLMLYNYELGLTREFCRIQLAFSIATCLCKEVYGSNSMILDMSNAIETLISHDKLLDI